MADNKKYYYMRLKENFFDTDEMVYLESLEEGYLFSNILLKLYLRSLKNEGVLMMNEYVPYDAKMISRFTNHSLSTVEKAIFEFKKLGLIEVLDSGQMYMSNIELFVGKTTTEADRKRLGRMKAEQKLLTNKEEGQMSDKCPPEKELELELEKELNNNIVETTRQDQLENKKQEVISFIINYLNEKTNKKFKIAKSNTQFINARLDDGYTVEDFVRVIDLKTKQWLNTQHDKYLRPSTLFNAEKMEAYVNEKENINKVTINMHDLFNDLLSEGVNYNDEREYNNAIPSNQLLLSE